MKKYLNYFIFRYALTYFLLSLICIITAIIPEFFLFFIGIELLIYTYVLHKKNRLKETDFFMQCFIILFLAMALTISLILSNGYLSSPYWNIYYAAGFPFLLFFGLASLSRNYAIVFIAPLIITVGHLMMIYAFTKPKISVKNLVIKGLCFVLLCSTSFYIYHNSPSRKYKGGHDFEYMGGYSTTDLSPFYVYNPNHQLVELSVPSTFTIEKETDMPTLDGAEACYPVYSAIAKAVYKDIDKIEEDYTLTEDYLDNNTNGKIVTFTNTSVGYSRLIQGEVDMFFGAKPSQSQLEEAKEAGVEFEYTPIGQEAFIFFVNTNNPVSNLSSNQIRSIYHGDITHWNEVGGNNQEILAFQRPERSGSQAMMTYFMGDVSLKEPLQYEYVSGMTGIISQTAEYNGEDDAIGYTFKYFLEGLHQEQNVKILSIDGVEPTAENIKSKTYPLSTYLYCVTLKSNEKENVQKLKDYLLSPQGQYIIEQTGYCSLSNS
ncbi:substrate-binding domain-containing protein [Allocoprobacillus halotolerans]|uniref:Substrate-binding domain-containing protein n=1 Tax=Allocoprobacillus halotolerans TaxID=2944914 RepID=A0ABY5I5C1_9FIRM|nr:substrate-binding domain-containing protein [Allocoprobacillus halotolerans]UTY40265.1 substrate-binding domain-containing protein [Allocoprobacillus halotolerans]